MGSTKILSINLGAVLWGSAPLIALTSIGSEKLIPYFAVPLTLVNVPLGLLISFTAHLQPGFSAAASSGNYTWVRETLQRILNIFFVASTVIGIGFVLFSHRFILLWTGGDLSIPPGMIFGTLVYSVYTAFISILRYTLAGINRHTFVGAADIAGGLASLCLGRLLFSESNYTSLGFALPLVSFLFGGWLLAFQVNRFTGTILLPSSHVLLSVTACSLLSIALTETLSWLAPFRYEAIAIAIEALTLTGTFFLTMFLFFRETFRDFIKNFRPGGQEVTPAGT